MKYVKCNFGTHCIHKINGFVIAPLKEPSRRWEKISKNIDFSLLRYTSFFFLYRLRKKVKTTGNKNSWFVTRHLFSTKGVKFVWCFFLGVMGNMYSPICFDIVGDELKTPAIYYVWFSQFYWHFLVKYQ